MKNAKKTKQILLCILIGVLVIAAVIGFVLFQWQKDIKEHPEGELETYLEECFGQDFAVTFDQESYFTSYISSDYIPFIVQTTLDDGTNMTLLVQWKRGYSVENGLYSDYASELVSHYANKYEISCDVTSNWVEITVKGQDLEGEDSVLKQFLTELWGTTFVQSGQQVELYLKSEEGYSYHLDMTWESLPYDEIYKTLTAS